MRERGLYIYSIQSQPCFLVKAKCHVENTYDICLLSSFIAYIYVHMCWCYIHWTNLGPSALGHGALGVMNAIHGIT